MSDLSARLALPFIAPSQAQKHVTHNEALQRLDLLVQMRVAAFGATVPPEVPEPGVLHALGAGAEGAWAGQDGRMAVFLDGAWLFLDPQDGWLAVEAGTGALRLYTADGWQMAPERLDRLGLGTAADATNRLAVAAQATLFSHAGAGHRLKINKAAASNTASLLFQSDFTGHAELGLAGNNDFHVKLSADGATWSDALRLDAQSGLATGQAVQSSATDTAAGRLMAVGAFGLGTTDVPDLADLDASAASGFYETAHGYTGGPVATGTFGDGVLRWERAGGNARYQLFARRTGSQDLWYSRKSNDLQAWTHAKLWNTANTTVDGSGFLLEASPVIRVYAAHIEEPVKPVGAALAVQGPGHYAISGTPPLAAEGWQVRSPRDIHGNEAARVADFYWHGGALHLHVADPFGRAANIPEGHFIMLRFWEAAAEGDTPPAPAHLTEAEVAGRLAAIRAKGIKAECRARILAVVPETAQMNIAQAVTTYTAERLRGATEAGAEAAAGLSDADFSTARAGRQWIAEMQAACRAMARDPGTDHTADAAWPAIPDGVAALVARF